ncbi:MAG TPA: biosynthetic arginine decarboxylase [Kiritimatiellia bacterium]|jgi:arginine decarboxylase|nr:biosynthetic arginine decarboxylase [Kiritimatiellia bacterium]HOR74933.1 biosynthetic arginine decarboxylase [Kiritimatiellia bacterium]HOU58809.1 biosynthetic arginine decarboxylase [Kiritimatiellia bacterium]HPK69255.1 biosynthetic arginine decarboxylase [Kiritimatiellia bacterium]HPV46240.1 biosynthetic arginine decarboxylase [Kiritimatiellia bacterium]
MSRGLTEALDGWDNIRSSELYGVEAWGNGYFHITEDGYAAVKLQNEQGPVSVKFHDIVRGLYQRGFSLPVLLRFSDLLAARIRAINEAFAKAIADSGYAGSYRGVYPIKVNQQHQTVADVVRLGAPFHHGLEAGSKAELIAALGYLHDPAAYIICNGYKDAEFIDLALFSLKMGLQTILVLEMPGELDLLLERAAKQNIRPRIGIRVKLASSVGGKWAESGGEGSVFGLTPPQVIAAVDRLRELEMLDCLELVHYHLGSQVPNIREIREAVREAAQYYTGLVKEGAKMGILDIGGGLAIDYDGSRCNCASSANYDVAEYAADVVEGVMDICDKSGVPHPVLISESGRALVGYYSVLLVNVLNTRAIEVPDPPKPLPKPIPEPIRNLMEVAANLRTRNLGEFYNDAIFYREEIQKAFKHGDITLRQHAVADRLFWHILTRIKAEVPKLRFVPDDMRDLEELMADIYYCNFSIFQSLPDSWAIDQLFPVMPIQRLNEKPTRLAVLSDITCDCDGKIDHFVSMPDNRGALPVHGVGPDEDYILAIFLVGAYQETLGDLHNLFGDTNVASIHVDDAGEITYAEEFDGDSVGDVLSYVEYNPQGLLARFRELAEEAVRQKRISATERREILDAYENGLRGYTYFET